MVTRGTKGPSSPTRSCSSTRSVKHTYIPYTKMAQHQNVRCVLYHVPSKTCLASIIQKFKTCWEQNTSRIQNLQNRRLIPCHVIYDLMADSESVIFDFAESVIYDFALLHFQAVALAHLDLGRAPYVLYGVEYIDLVSLGPARHLQRTTRSRTATSAPSIPV